MTSGDLLWFLAIGAFFYFMMKNGGGCCGGNSHGSHGDTRTAGSATQGGCCGGHDSGGHEAGDGEHHHEDGKEGRLESHGVQQIAQENPPVSPSAKDPVCGMEVARSSAGFSSEYLGGSYHFCSERCKNIFDIHPGKYT